MFSRWFGGGGAKVEEEKPREPPVAPNDVYFCRPKLNPGYLIPPYLATTESADAVRPKSIQTLEQRLAELNEKEKEAYDAMVKALGPEVFAQQGGFTVLRYLVARKWDVDAATKLLQGTVEWRKTLPAVCKWCSDDPASHIAEFCGWSKSGSPVIYMTYRYAKERGDASAAEVHMSSTFDHAVRMMPEGCNSWVTLVDFASFSIMRDSSIAVAKKILGVLSDHFPERLGTFVMVNPVKGTWMLYKALSFLLDDKTKSKVKFAYSNGSPSLQTVFDELFPPHVAKYLIARYSENFQNLPLGALEGASEEDIAKHTAQAAKEHNETCEKTMTLEEAEKAGDATEDEQTKK